MNVGTIGTGGITTWFLTCWQETGNSCYAMYSRNQKRGEALRTQFHGEKVYTELDSFLADENIDVVYVASPNSLHVLHAKQALLANKHVILEKPFTSTVEECEQLIQIAKERDLFLMEGITVVDLPNYAKLASLLDRIGTIRMAVANMSKVSSKYEAYVRGERPNVFQTAYSGGALMDLNVYQVHLMTLLFGMPKTLSYIAQKRDGIDFHGVLTMQYEDHLAICIAAKDSEASNNVEIQGEKGFLRIGSAAAMLSSIELHTAQGVETYQLQDHELTHIYYIRAYLKMIEEKDYVQRDQRLAHTLDVMKVLVTARKDADIHFEADQ